MVAYVIALLWNLPLWTGKNTKDLAYDTWQPNTSKHGRLSTEYEYTGTS